VGRTTLKEFGASLWTFSEVRTEGEIGEVSEEMIFGTGNVGSEIFKH